MKSTKWSDRADEILDVVEAARFSGKPPSDVLRAIAKGSLGDERGPLRRRDVAAWIESEQACQDSPAADQLPEGLLSQLLSDGVVTAHQALGQDALQSLRFATARLLAQRTPSPPAERIEQVTPRGPVLERIRNIAHIAPPFAALAGHPLLQALGKCLFSEYVVYQVSVVVKLPHIGVAMPAHRDPTWTTRALPMPVFTVGFYLDEAGPENGGTWFCRGSHLPRAGRALEVATAEPREPLRVQAGAAVIHNLGVVHGSEVNRSASLRRTVYCSVMSLAEARASGRFDGLALARLRNQCLCTERSTS